MKAGLFRSFTSMVDAERLARVETQEWRDLVFVMCFMHSAVQERRKFGPQGWSVPYEFNTGDLEASLTFLEKHSFSPMGLNFATIQYMICEVQYGGRIVDDLDRVLFNTFGNTWLNQDIFGENFLFSPQIGNGFKYCVPHTDSLEDIHKFIQTMPSYDAPEIFGLHSNSDLTYGTSQATYILSTIGDTQPKAANVGGGKTREEIVVEKCDELLAQLPPGYKDPEVRELVRKRSSKEMREVLGYSPEERVDGFTIPLNVFLYQEITRLNKVISIVRSTLTGLKQAIAGEIIMTPQLLDALEMVFTARPPKNWYLDAGGAEFAWVMPSLGLWFGGLLDREKQLSSWLNNTRPISFWMTGFFNPTGFLTGVRQEVTRRHKAEKWALDDVVLKTDLTEQLNLRFRSAPDEGVYVHGLVMEGAAWMVKEKVIRESNSGRDGLFCPMPIMRVTAITSERSAKIYKEGEYYDCPCYVRPRRNALTFVFKVKLNSNEPPEHWVLRGVALLCSKD
jgi:dynein heavy chain